MHRKKASLKEIISTFWYAAELADLQTVYIGINFNLYNELVNHDRTQSFSKIKDNFLFYFSEESVIRSTFYLLTAFWTGKLPDLERPPMSRDEFWKFQLAETARRMYQNYEYPENYYSELKAIVEYCKDNGVHISFIIFPTHTDLQKRADDFGLTSDVRRFRKNLNSLGRVYDFDTESPVTKNQKNFKDPFHFTPSVMKELVKIIWAIDAS